MENKKYNNKKYIYNIEFANDMIKFGINAIGCGFNAKTERTFIVFDYYDAQKYYEYIDKRGKYIKPNNENKDISQTTL